VPEFRAATLAPMITVPLWSFTTPEMVPPVLAKADGQPDRISSARTSLRSAGNCSVSQTSMMS